MFEILTLTNDAVSFEQPDPDDANNTLTFWLKLKE